MKVYEIELTGKQYARLEKMLTYENSQKLSMNQPINGYDFFGDMLDEIYSPIEDGWSTIEVVMEESKEELELLRYITKHILPNDEDYFVRQLGKDAEDFQCDEDFEIKIELNL